MMASSSYNCKFLVGNIIAKVEKGLVMKSLSQACGCRRVCWVVMMSNL